jgi:hypothetical protein
MVKNIKAPKDKLMVGWMVKRMMIISDEFTNQQIND